MSKLLLSIVGPTAIGKTKLAILLAQRYGTEILSADSRQFFKEMTVGTAVPDLEELSAAKHHFIQHKSITELYSVGDFEKEAIKLLDELFTEDSIVIIVGGSGLYIDAVNKGLDEFPKVAPHIRAQLNQELKDDGIVSLKQKLQLLDSKYYNKVDVNNPHRLVRALEICIGTGKPYSSFLSKPRKERNFKTLSVGLNSDRQLVYDTINRRVDVMMEKGLLEEVRSLQQYKDLNALQTVGYKELFAYLDGTWNLPTAISEIKKNTRRFAKRQVTWFKRNPNTLWIDPQNNQNNTLDIIHSAIEKIKSE